LYGIFLDQRDQFLGELQFPFIDQEDGFIREGRHKEILNEN
jgi:hypothetical protein